MGTSRGKISPEVALLVRRVEMDERFRVEPKPGNNKVNITGPNGEPLIISMDADSSDFRRAERSLERMGLRSEDRPPAPQVRQRVKTTPITDPYPTITVFEKAKKVWKSAKDYAVATGKSIGLVDGVEYFVIDDRPLTFFIAKHYRKIEHYSGPGGTQEIYDFLRSTGNYARERDNDDTSAYVIRCEWSDAGSPVVVRHPRKAVSDWEREQIRKESRVTPHEAGEDRKPFPVEVRTIADVVTVTEEEVTGQPTAPKPAPPVANTEDERLLAEARARQESLTCPECKGQKKKFVAENPQGLAAHRRSRHGVQGHTYEPSVVGKISKDSALAEVGYAFDMLRDALSKVTQDVDHTSCHEQTEAARKEAEYQTADAQVQRERAERAEEVLNLIWLAFSEMPQHKAVAEVLGLLPPLKE